MRTPRSVDVTQFLSVASEPKGRFAALPLDATDRDAVFTAVNAAVEHFGRLDIVVNNAGTMSSGMVEEFTEAEARAQLEVNLFGAMWVCQAVLPHLRAQASGHIVQVSSIAALGGFPSTGMYSASKFALEGMSEARAMEAAPFGVKLSILQPGGYWTGSWSTAKTRRCGCCSAAWSMTWPSTSPAGGWRPGLPGSRSAAPPNTPYPPPTPPVDRRTSVNTGLSDLRRTFICPSAIPHPTPKPSLPKPADATKPCERSGR
ncbi:MAG TPA: SDR family NAD(P)-dependent oxidoreductase [Nonomuraea sp.]|nr:SDR family NAD(P)-dependent oxidoreductase [Nonomuraea sp.]